MEQIPRGARNIQAHDGHAVPVLRLVERRGGLFAAVFLPLVAVYLLTATWNIPYHIDPLSNAVTGWYLAETGSPVLTEHAHLVGDEYVANVGWYVESERGVVSQYPPGAALASVPLYLVADSPLQTVMLSGYNRPDVPPVEYPLPPLWPATATASVMTAAAMGFLALAFRSLVTARTALAGALLAGLGTSAWSVASDALWQHGPAMFWVALSLYLLATGRLTLSGVALAGAVLTRPPLALVAVGIGVGAALQHRSFKPLFKIGLPASLGFAVLLAFNWWLFGALSISGGYGDAFTEQALQTGLGWYLANILGGLFDVRSGLLIWSPFLLLLVPGIRKGWRALPPGLRGAAVGGAVYLLVQWKANRFSGGDGFFAYRYPLEPLMAAAPLLLLAHQAWITTPRGARFFAGLAVAAMTGQLIGSLLT